MAPQEQEKIFVRSNSLLSAAVALVDREAQFAGSLRIDTGSPGDTALLLEVPDGPKASIVYDASGRHTMLIVDGTPLSSLRPDRLDERTLYKTLGISLRISPTRDQFSGNLQRAESKFQWSQVLKDVSNGSSPSLVSLGFVQLEDRPDMTLVHDAFGLIASFKTKVLLEPSQEGAIARYTLTRLTHGVNASGQLTDIRWI